MKICHCNNCGNNYEDPNPGNDSIDYPDDMILTPLGRIFYEGSLEYYWGCPVCLTDDYLMDNKINEDETA